MPTGFEPAITDKHNAAIQRKVAYQRTVAAAQQHFEHRRFEAAAQAFDLASRMAVGDAGPIFNQALSLQNLGRIDEALRNYQRIRFGPLRLQVLFNLATLVPEVISTEEEAAMAAAARAPGGDSDTRAKQLFALGNVLDHQGRYDEAFVALAEANRLRAASVDVPRAAAREIATMAAIRKDFTPASLARWSGHGHRSAAPIFIVGKPRSGTTLIEQILASHPDVQGMGEPPSLGETVDARVNWTPAEEAVSDHFRQLGGDYLRSIRRRGWRQTHRFVDKLPQNFFYIGVIALAFPRATILHSVRDPMDTSLSWFQHAFDAGNELSYDLAEIGRSYVRYRELIDYWATVLPGRVVEVRHEDLVADPERRIRWLVTEACGLPWDDACLEFHANDRPVLTPSGLQVRRPIFTSSIGRWKHYERHLASLIEALGPYGPAAVRARGRR